MKLFNLSGKRCLITGAGGLLGRYHAEAILEAGGSVILTDINRDSIVSLSNDLISSLGRLESERVCWRIMDVTKKESILSAMKSIGPVDILINNAAKDPKVNNDGLGQVVNESRFEMMSLETWKDGLDVSMNGAFLVTQAVINSMIDNKIEGVVLNIASDLGVIAPDQRLYKNDGENFEDQNVKPIFYSASKWALVGMTKYLATYFAAKNIRVNSISPGGVFNNHPDNFTKKISNLIPMARMANVDEYKGAVIFACSGASSYMTGHNIILDGGRSLW
jgi:NAD(P)-dependent dehydrogenase (short-subunit alcohol dehydrogenase family)